MSLTKYTYQNYLCAFNILIGSAVDQATANSIKIESKDPRKQSHLGSESPTVSAATHCRSTAVPSSQKPPFGCSCGKCTLSSFTPQNFFHPWRMTDDSSRCYFKLPNHPNFNRSLSVSVPLTAIAQANQEIDATTTVSSPSLSF